MEGIAETKLPAALGSCYHLVATCLHLLQPKPKNLLSPLKEAIICLKGGGEMLNVHGNPLASQTGSICIEGALFNVDHIICMTEEHLKALDYTKMRAIKSSVNDL